VRVTWSGFVGGPGVSTFYAVSAADLVVPLKTFFDVVAGITPNEIDLLVEPTGETLVVETGAISGTWAATPVGAVTGSEGGDYAAPVGAQVTWFTDGIVSRHRVKGRTYLVPIAANKYNNQGGINPPVKTLLDDAAAALISDSSANLQVWHRPVADTGGQAFDVTVGLCGVKAAVLRSRRD
jgi:hypothetical protein